MTTERLIRDLKRISRDANDLLDSTRENVGEKAKEARKRLTAALETARETCQELEDKTIASAKATDKVIRDHPYPTIGIAFAVGVLLGILANQRD